MCRKYLQQLISQDFNLTEIENLTPFLNQRDPNHLARRQQQRAINDDTIELAIAYGMKRFFSNGAIAYTLTDRCLQDTPYFKFVDQLRGLTVICQPGVQGLEIHTAYWDFKIKARVSKCRRYSFALT